MIIALLFKCLKSFLQTIGETIEQIFRHVVPKCCSAMIYVWVCPILICIQILEAELQTGVLDGGSSHFCAILLITQR